MDIPIVLMRKVGLREVKEQVYSLRTRSNLDLCDLED